LVCFAGGVNFFLSLYLGNECVNENSFTWQDVIVFLVGIAIVCVGIAACKFFVVFDFSSLLLQFVSRSFCFMFLFVL